MQPRLCACSTIFRSHRAGLARDVRRVLRRNGFLAVYQHNPFNPLTSYVVKNCEFDKDASLLRSKEAEAVLKQAGFGSVETRFILAFPAKGLTAASH